MHTLAIDDGLWAGHLDLADLAFLIAFATLLVVAVLTWVRTKTLDAGLSPLALALIAFGLLVL